MSFPSYPKYKNSGIEWLGDIPVDWAVGKFRHLFRESSEKIDGQIVGPMLSVSGYRGIEIKEYDDENRRRLEEDLQGYRVVRVGQLVINTMWLNYAGLGVSEFEGHVSPAYRSYEIGNGLDKRFVHHLMRSSTYVQGYTRLLTGIRPNSLQMSRDDLMEFPVLKPPHREQVDIAAFLDCETAKIDALTAEQRQLIELLKEKRQAVISHAVTKGLNPNAPMKPSGIEWLGDVPEHWEVRKLRNLARLESGHTPSRQRPDYWIEEDCVIPWFTLADVGFLRDYRNIFIESTSQKISQIGMENSAARLLPPETVLLSRTASVGFSGITSVPLAVSQDFAAWICGPKIRPGYLLHCLRAMKTEFRRLMMGSTHQTIYMPDIEAFRIPVPSVAEQLAISAFIGVEQSRLDALIDETQRGVDLLQERRAALISAAVIGKIDVRGLVPAKAEAA
jgi:type I restriction enzyme, S subunit